MRDETHIGFVYAHAEGHGGDHDHAFFAQEAALIARPSFVVQARVIGQSVPALFPQPQRGLVDFLARQAIHHARIVLMFAVEKSRELLARVIFLHHAIADVGAVEAGDELACLFQGQPLDDLATRRRVGGGGQRDARHIGKAFVQYRQRAVIGAEIVSPLRHAMRLVDGEQGHAGRGFQPRQQAEEMLVEQTFGRDVKQIQLALEQLLLHAARVVRIHTGIQKCGAHPQLQQGLHLVLHQRDERRNDDAHAGTQQSGELVAQ